MDLTAETLRVPASIITRLRGKEMEILVASTGRKNPFLPGQREMLLGSGLFWEEIVRTRASLTVDDGRKLEEWKHSPQVRDGWVAHLGHPLFLPGGLVFGTFCVQDRRPRTYRAGHEVLLKRFRDLVEAQIALLVLEQKQRDKGRILESYREELRQLRRTFPLCPSCKRIRNDPEYWEAVEEYFVTHAMGEFGHGLCPECAEKHWGETVLEPEPVPLPRGLGISGTARA